MRLDDLPKTNRSVQLDDVILFLAAYQQEGWADAGYWAVQVSRQFRRRPSSGREWWYAAQGLADVPKITLDIDGLQRARSAMTRIFPEVEGLTASPEETDVILGTAIAAYLGLAGDEG